MFASLFLDPSKKRSVLPAGHKVRQVRNQSTTLDDQLTLGERVYCFPGASHGEDYAAAYWGKHLNKNEAGKGRPATREDDQPRGFWRSFVRDVQRLEHTKALQMKAFRAFHVFLDRTGSQPTMTRVTARGERKGKSCRSSGGAYNALKGAGGLWHALLQ